jgi:hypothetical protein
MRRRKVWILVGVLLLAIAVAGYYVLSNESPVRVGMTQGEVDAVLGEPIALGVPDGDDSGWAWYERKLGWGESTQFIDVRFSGGKVVRVEAYPPRVRHPKWADQMVKPLRDRLQNWGCL